LEFPVRLAARPTPDRGLPDTVIERGVPRSFLGVTVDETVSGLRLAAVLDDGPAARAGLRVGDRILQLGGGQVRSLEQLDGVLRESRPGQELTIVVSRDGAPQELRVVLGAGPAATPDGETRPRALERPAEDPLVFGYDLGAAQERARVQGRPLLLVFAASWSDESKTLRAALADPGLRSALTRNERVWIDTDRQSALADRFDVEAVPHLILFTSGGRSGRP
jgi:hypothetical protein